MAFDGDCVCSDVCCRDRYDVQKPRSAEEQTGREGKAAGAKPCGKIERSDVRSWFYCAGLGVRFGWYVLPSGGAIGGAVVFLAAYLLYAEVLRENTYLSHAIQVQEDQKVIDTGLYGIVRHPMYSVTLLLFLSMPVVLGSVYSFVIFLAYPLIIAKRIKHEEEFLEKELAGYDDYKQEVKYRLIPFVW